MYYVVATAYMYIIALRLTVLYLFFQGHDYTCTGFPTGFWHCAQHLDSELKN